MDYISLSQKRQVDSPVHTLSLRCTQPGFTTSIRVTRGAALRCIMEPNQVAKIVHFGEMAWPGKGVGRPRPDIKNSFDATCYHHRCSPWRFWGSLPKELHTLPELWLRLNSHCIPVNNTMAAKYTTTSIIQKRLAFRRFSATESRHSANSVSEMCYFYFFVEHVEYQVNISWKLPGNGSVLQGRETVTDHIEDFRLCIQLHSSRFLHRGRPSPCLACCEKGSVLCHAGDMQYTWDRTSRKCLRTSWNKLIRLHTCECHPQWYYTLRWWIIPVVEGIWYIHRKS